MSRAGKRAMFLSVHCVCVRSAQAMRALLRSHDLVFGTRVKELLPRRRRMALHGSVVALVFCHLLYDNFSQNAQCESGPAWRLAEFARMRLRTF